MNIPVVATIGKGVTVRESSIPGGGNGLFTERPFNKNDLVTEYCGPTIDHEKALKLRRRGKHTHVRVLNSQWLYIDGLKVPVPGQGGASFANDARDSAINNAMFVQKFDRKLGRDRVFLKATRDLREEEEVFVSYGNTYWRNSRSDPQPIAKQQPQRARTAKQQQQPNQQKHQQLLHQTSNPKCSKPRSRKPAAQQVEEQQSADSSDTVQQLAADASTAATAAHPAAHLPGREVIQLEAKQAVAELQQLASTQRQRQQGQQQQHPGADANMVAHNSGQGGSQESSTTQIGCRRSVRVRVMQVQQQQELEQQRQELEQQQQHQLAIAYSEAVLAQGWGVHKKRSSSYVRDSSTAKVGKRSRSNSSSPGDSSQKPRSSWFGKGFAGVLRQAAGAVLRRTSLC